MNRFKAHFSLVVLVLLFLPLLSAVAQDQHIAVSQYAKKFWQLEEGLPQNSVNALAQTEDGYLWIGTEEGLARFNGIEFTIFDGLTEPVFENGHSIRALLADGDALWIGTDGTGLIYYNEGEFTLVDNALIEAGAQVNTLFKTSGGDVIVGTDTNGLFRMAASDNLEAIYFFEDGSIRGITEDESGIVYIATGSGLFQFTTDGRVRSFGPPNLQSQEISSLFRDSRDRSWISTRDGTIIVSPNGDQQTISTTRALTFLEDTYGDVWAGLDGGGVLRHNDSRTEIIGTEHGLTHNKVVALIEDAEGSIWIGTEGGGLGQLRRTPFVTFGAPEGMASEMVLTIATSHDGKIWAGTEGGGLYEIDPAAEEPLMLVPGTSDEIITSLAPVSSDLLMIGTYFGGLWQMKDGELMKAPFNDRLPEGSIAAMSVAPDGTLLLGTDGGVVKVRADGDYFDIIDTDDGLGSNYITALHEDQSGRLWIGTYDAGLYVLQGGIVTAVDAELDDTILCIQEDSSGKIWLSTLRNGLFIYDGEFWSDFDRKNGLPTNTIYQLVFDELDGLWMTSNKGLIWVSRNQAFNASANDQVADVRMYGREDGLRTFEFNGGVQPAGAIDTSGKVWLPSIRGLVSFDPSAVLTATKPPQVLIESLASNGEAVVAYPQGASRIFLEPGQDRLDIALASMTLSFGRDAEIEYMLYDFEDRWNTAKSGETITYTNLVPGDYIFRIRSVVDTPAGVVFSKEKHVVLVLEPRFYQFTIFWIIVALMTALAIIVVHRIRVKHIRRAEQERRTELEAIVDQRTEELKTLNDQLEERVQRQVQFILSVRENYEKELVEAHERARESEQLKSTILRNLSHEFRTPITSIIGFADIIEEKLDKEDREFIKYIKESASRLSETLLVIVDMSELEARVVHIHDSLVGIGQVLEVATSTHAKQIAEKGLGLVVDVDPRLSAVTDSELLSKIVSILVSNATKFTERGEISIRAEQDEDTVTIHVSDTGVGIREEFLPDLFAAFKQESSGHDRKYQGVGLGLTVASQLLTLLQGTIRVESKVGEGSTFSVRLPKKPSKVNGSDREAISHLSERFATDPVRTPDRSIQ